MNGSLTRLFVVLGLGCGIPALLGCAEFEPARVWALRMIHRDFSDTVPGLVSPAERIAVLRKMGQKAASADPLEQQRISAELAAALAAEADPLIRMEIVRALGGYATPEAASALAAALNDPDCDVRVAACEAWGKRGGPEATASLSRVLSSDLDMDVRLAAARALGETGDPGAVVPLGEALEDRDPAMQYLAVQGLRNTTGEDFGNDVSQWRLYVRGELPPAERSISLVERLRRLY